MEIGIIEVRYPYKMSYLDEWLNGWKEVSDRYQVFNILKESEVKCLRKKLSSLDLIVILHSVTADSNKWIKNLTHILLERRCPLILFVGNEYSNPWLSMELRLESITEIRPEVIATQLSIIAGEFLYGDSGALILEVPHALPSRKVPKDSSRNREVDLGFRGFDYPWFLLDSERNSVVDQVSDFYVKNQKKVDISKSQRLDKDDWYSFLANCKSTVASEGGSNFVFKTDAVWIEALNFLNNSSPSSYFDNDFRGANLLRSLPLSVKKKLRAFGKILGKEQGAMSKLSRELLEGVIARINVEDFKYVSGKALTSRHMDAIYCGTWQILTPGSYNGILEQGKHYSVWNPSDPALVFHEVEEAILSGRSTTIYEELIDDNSYQSRISGILGRLNS
jgi:hypothetical protein